MGLPVKRNLRWIKAGQTLGMTDHQLVAYDYLLSVSTKACEKSFGGLPDFDKVTIPVKYKPKTFEDYLDDKEDTKGVDFKVRPARIPLRYGFLSRELGLSEHQVAAYDFIQSINPKVFEEVFGSRPTIDEIDAPARFELKLRLESLECPVWSRRLKRKELAA
jgi:hypothetical protein